ncbi:MAG: hypothetical protein ACLRH0_01160 [Blautia wexlerae]
MAERNILFNMNENLMGPLNDSKLLKSTLNNNNNFELDSNATSSTMVPAISTLIKNDSLLKNGTWAYLGSGKNKNRRYFFWTSVNVSNFPTGTKFLSLSAEQIMNTMFPSQQLPSEPEIK